MAGPDEELAEVHEAGVVDRRPGEGRRGQEADVADDLARVLGHAVPDVVAAEQLGEPFELLGRRRRLPARRSERAITLEALHRDGDDGGRVAARGRAERVGAHAVACAAQSAYSAAYGPPASISSSWLPCSTIRPYSRTTMRPAWRMVDRRCAMTIAVRPASRRRSPASIRPSVCRSTFDVASSSTRMRGSAISARAKATSWRCPAESW